MKNRGQGLGTYGKKNGGLVSHDFFLKKVRVILRFWLLVLRSVAFFFKCFSFFKELVAGNLGRL